MCIVCSICIICTSIQVLATLYSICVFFVNFFELHTKAVVKMNVSKSELLFS